jgi:nitric-oxide synthase
MSYIRISSVDPLDSSSSSSNQIGSVVHVGPLSNIRFAVFALGSSAYPNFCAFGLFVDKMLADLGGERIAKLATGDELCGQEQVFTEWSKKLFREAVEVFCIADEVNMSEVLQTASLKRTTWTTQDVRLIPTEMPINTMQTLASGSHRKIVKFLLQSVSHLYESAGMERMTIKVCLEVEDKEQEFSYLPGDHVGIFPENPDHIIDAIADRLPNLDFDQTYIVLVKSAGQKMEETESDDWIPHERLPRVSLREALRRYIDIMATPSQQALALLSNACDAENERDKLRELATEAHSYEDWKSQNMPTFLDLLHMFPSLNPAAEFILTQMPPLQPRFYSISSSPLYNSYMKFCSSQKNSGASSNERMISSRIRSDMDGHVDCFQIELTVAVVSFYVTRSQRLRHGICSNFLFNMGTNSPGHIVYGFIRSAPNFRMPDKEDVPIVMVGPGTGIAPFRGFWLQRYACVRNQPHKRFGSMTLFCGCRLPCMQLYKDEVERMREAAVVRDVHVAFSRSPDHPKVSI